jgi:hypothetical protein
MPQSSRLWRKRLAILAMASGAFVILGFLMFLKSLTPFRGLPDGPPSEQSDALARKLARTEKGKLLAAGAPGMDTPADTWRPLWESDPSNPAYLARYTLAFHETHRALSPEIVEAAGRMDPDNGWFVALEASCIAGKAVRAESSASPRKPDSGEAFKIRIFDRDAFERTLGLLREARSKPNFSSYQSELCRGKLAALPRPSGVMGSVALGMASLDRLDSPLPPLGPLFTALAAAAGDHARRGDEAGFDDVLASWRWLARAVIEQPDTYFNQTMARSLACRPLRHFRDAAASLGRANQAAAFAAADDSYLESRESDSKTLSPEEERQFAMNRRAPVYSEIDILECNAMTKHPTPIHERDIRPARLAGYDLLGRIFAGVVWLALGLIAGCVIVFAKSGKRELASRLVLLLDRRDWQWILAVGVGGPVLWYLAITRLTPLSTREYALSTHYLIYPTAQFIPLLLLLALTPIAAARHRLGRLGIIAKSGWLKYWIPVAIAALAVPAAGAVEHYFYGSLFGQGMIVAGRLFCGIAAVWLLVLAVIYASAKPKLALRLATVGAAAFPAWMLAMLLGGMSIPFHMASEFIHTRADKMLSIPTDSPANHHYEALCAEQSRLETMEMIGHLLDAP